MFDACDRDPIEAYGDIKAWQRLLVRVFRRPRREKDPIGARLRRFALKPPKPGAPAEVLEPPKTVEELRAQAKSANDKERLIGLLAAPWAAGIAIVITNALISNDPAAPNKLHVSISLYHEVEVALLALSLIALVMAWWRKRLYVGIALALYGLTVFNLHYWGFGIPFLLIGAWFIVRAYRFQRSVKEATGEANRYGPSRPAGGGSGVRPPRPNKRYTPPVSRS